VIPGNSQNFKKLFTVFYCLLVGDRH